MGVAVQVAGGAGGGAAGPARYLSTLDTDTDDGVRTRRVVMPVCGVRVELVRVRKGCVAG